MVVKNKKFNQQDKSKLTPKKTFKTPTAPPQKEAPPLVPSKKSNSNEVKIYGYHAVLSVWKNRPDAIIRVYLTKERLKVFSELLKWCAAHKKAYHVVTEEDLDKVAAGVHHEGVCVLMVQRRRWEFDRWLEQKGKELAKNTPLLFLEGVENPHNVGSIVRVCAHFGVQYVLGIRGSLPRLSASAYRVAEGGAEFVELVEVADALQSFKKLKTLGFEIVATSSHAKKSLYDHKFAGKSVIVLGAEIGGLSSKILNQGADKVLSIEGTGHVQSLNVALAGGIILSEYLRQTRA